MAVEETQGHREDRGQYKGQRVTEGTDGCREGRGLLGNRAIERIEGHREDGKQ